MVTGVEDTSVATELCSPLLFGYKDNSGEFKAGNVVEFVHVVYGG